MIIGVDNNVKQLRVDAGTSTIFQSNQEVTNENISD